MKRKRMLIILATVLIALSLVSMTSVAGPVRENHCVKQWHKINDIVTRYVRSDTWVTFRRSFEEKLTPAQVAAVTENVSDMLVRNGLPKVDPMFDVLVSLIVGYYWLLAIFIGNNCFTTALCFATSAVLVLPAIILVNGLCGFLVMIPLVMTWVLIELFGDFSLPSLMERFGIIGVAIITFILLPLITVAVLGVMIVAFPLAIFPKIITDFIQVYEEAYKIIYYG